MSHTPISENEFERIESYLLQRLSETEVAQFKNELASNSELAAKTETVRIQIAAVKDAGRKEYLNTIHSSSEKGKVRQLNSPFSKLKSLSVAASVAVLIGIAAIYILSQNQSDNLYAIHFTPDEGLITPMGSSENYEFFRGMVDYKQGNYHEAITRWKEQLELKKDNDTLNYFIGVSLMAESKTKEAIPYLKKAEKTEASAFYSDILYYRGLAELNEGNKDIAKAYFSRSATPKAKKLLDLLNQK